MKISSLRTRAATAVACLCLSGIINSNGHTANAAEPLSNGDQFRQGGTAGSQGSQQWLDQRPGQRSDQSQTRHRSMHANGAYGAGRQSGTGQCAYGNCGLGTAGQTTGRGAANGYGAANRYSAGNGYRPTTGYGSTTLRNQSSSTRNANAPYEFQSRSAASSGWDLTGYQNTPNTGLQSDFTNRDGHVHGDRANTQCNCVNGLCSCPTGQCNCPDGQCNCSTGQCQHNLNGQNNNRFTPATYRSPSVTGRDNYGPAYSPVNGLYRN